MYRVIWIEKALGDLARAWAQSNPNLQNSITAAVQIIDQKLQNDPFEDSESRSGNTRILFVPPLGVMIEVDEGNRNVRVVATWRFSLPGD